MKLTWPEMKDFIDNNLHLSLDYLERSDSYMIWTSHGGRTFTVPQLNKDEATDFETNYKSSANRPEANRIRTRTSREDYYIHSRSISWTTSDPSKTINNNDHHGADFADCTMKFYSAYDVETTNASLAKFTEILFAPTFSYDVEEGNIIIPQSLPGIGEWEAHTVFLPNVPAAAQPLVPVYDHPVVANPRLDLITGKEIVIDAKLNHAHMPYVIHPVLGNLRTNEIKVLIGHPVGEQATFQLMLSIYKEGK